MLGIAFYALIRIKRHNLNSNYLIAIHTLRLPVELVLYQLYLAGKIPKIMTFHGWNLDILSGLTALIILVYPLITKKYIRPSIVFIWNSIGLVFLAIIVSLAILSAPLPIQQFGFAQPNIAVFEFPYCYLPTCIVPIVLLSHILIIKSYKQASMKT